MKKILISSLVSLLIISCSSQAQQGIHNVSNSPSQIFNGIIAGSSMSGVTKTGVDLSEDTSNTDPLLIIVTDGQNKGCFVSSQMRLDVNSNRIGGTLQSMSCVLKNQSVVDKRVHGYVVDNDGKAGVIATVGHNKSGKKFFSINAGTKLTIVFTDAVTN